MGTRPHVIMKMVRFERDSLNTVFDELARWEEVLKDTSVSKKDNDHEP